MVLLQYVQIHVEKNEQEKNIYQRECRPDKHQDKAVLTKKDYFWVAIEIDLNLLEGTDILFLSMLPDCICFYVLAPKGIHHCVPTSRTYLAVSWGLWPPFGVHLCWVYCVSLLFVCVHIAYEAWGTLQWVWEFFQGLEILHCPSLAHRPWQQRPQKDALTDLVPFSDLFSSSAKGHSAGIPLLDFLCIWFAVAIGPDSLVLITASCSTVSQSSPCCFQAFRVDNSVFS